MIKYLEVNNFKSHKNTKIDLANLTVFCGSNSVGKSSVFQPLLLLREAYLNKTNFEYLDLLSNSIKIGTIADAFYQYSENDEIIFQIKTKKDDYVFSFELENNDYTKTLINSKKNKFVNGINPEISLFNENFQYISSNRIGPQESYKKDDVVVEKYKQISLIEGNAEFCIHFLHKNQSYKVLNELVNDNSFGEDLIYQVTSWEKEISKGVNVIVEDNGKLGFELKYQYDTQYGNEKTNKFSSLNVGFGLSYVLPILVAILSAKKDALIIIENPEAHLHPKGIAKLTELICLASQAGIQIILETHSDHIINGILVQSKKFEQGGKGIDRNNVSIYQFDRDEEEHCTKATKIEVREEGRISFAPEGFFDQSTIDTDFLFDL